MIEVGQKWEEVDTRFKRIIEVVSLPENGKVKISNTETGRITKASIERFNGERGGYKLIEQEIKS